MNLIASSKLPVPLPLVPLIGGIAGLFFCRYSRMGSNPSQPHGVRNDFAWRRRTGRLLLAYPA